MPLRLLQAQIKSPFRQISRNQSSKIGTKLFNSIADRVFRLKRNAIRWAVTVLYCKKNARNTCTMTTELVNKRLVRSWLGWSLLWLSVFPLIGVLVSIKFHNPEFLGDTDWLSFGRLRPVHVNGVVFGAFSTPLIGLLYYVIPRLCGRAMAKEFLGWWALAGWNIFLIAGSISLVLGYNLGYEAGEFQWPFNILRWLVLAVVGGQVLVTIFRRKESSFYVSLWYVIAGLCWVLLNLILGNVILPYYEMSGINNAALHGLYIHYVVGLWVTPVGNALIYYFIPVATKSPLYSHRLSIFGFWSIAFLYPFVGTHHYLFSPIPHSTQTISIVTSMLLIIPVWAVVTNWLGTYMGRWREVLRARDADGYAAKFLLLATFYYLFGCFQGSIEALRTLQILTHFNDFVISHSHFTMFGTYINGVVGAMYYVWPRITGKNFWSMRLVSWHLWLTLIGTIVMFGGLTVQGIIQGGMLNNGANFVDSSVVMKPWWLVRTMAGISTDIGFLLMLFNFVMSYRHNVQFSEPVINKLETYPAASEQKHWYSNPSSVFVFGGMGFFFLAVLVQGITPSIDPATNTSVVSDARTGLAINVADYTPQESRGRQIYIREGCWYCHSQYTRPVSAEDRRWGPVSQAGEYAYDQPHLLSTRRIGPDLTRVGRRYSDDWHRAHYWNPRQVVPDSIMPRFPWLFEQIDNDETPRLNTDGEALVAYIQRLGTGIGDWREVFTSTNVEPPIATTEPRKTDDDSIALGKLVYQRRCSGCHGEHGDGNGPAARFLDIKPRNFVSGIFKFRSTLGGSDSLPSDADLYRTISHGLWGTAMPPWYNLTETERHAVIEYIKTFSSRWHEQSLQKSFVLPPERAINPDALKQGRQIFEQICAMCHGQTGGGDGPAAEALTDAWGYPVRPANFTLPAGEPGGVKLGHNAGHIFSVIMTGVGGTPMPPFADTFSNEEIWDIVHYVQSLRVDAHIEELLAAGLSVDDEQIARQKIWSSLSHAAQQGNIADAILEAYPDQDRASKH